MIRTLTKQGNSLALIIERPIRELLNIGPDTPLVISVEGRRLIVEPLSDEEREKRFEKALEETHRKYGSVFKKLAE